MLVNYIQSIMLTVLEIICCKIFFESFAEKRSENNWRNCSIILGTVICGYIIALWEHPKVCVNLQTDVR